MGRDRGNERLAAGFPGDACGIAGHLGSRGGAQEQDAILLEDLAGTAVFLNRLQPQATEFFVWYAKRPGLTQKQRVSTAWQLAGKFNMPELAASLLEGISEVEGNDNRSVHAKVAEARLAKGYDAASARLVTGAIFDELARVGNSLRVIQRRGAR